MKKLMFAAATMIAGFAMAVESQIVGYSCTVGTYGYCPMGSAFKNITGEAFSIQDIKPVAPEGSEVEPGVYFIYGVNDGGATSDETYVYLLADGDTHEKDGWYDINDDTIYATRTFLPGEAFLFDVDMDGASAMSSGLVDLNEVVTPGVYGYCPMCNPYPVTINIQNITPVPPEGSEVEPGVYFIYGVNDGGATSDETYVYLLADGDTHEKDGWYDINDDTIYATREYNAGEGFLFDVDMDGAGAAFTCPAK